ISATHPSTGYADAAQAGSAGEEFAIPFKTDLDLGAHVEVSVRREEGNVTLEARSLQARIARSLPINSAERGLIQVLALQTRKSIALVSVSGKEGRAAALIADRGGRPELLWMGRLDPVGDPGERVWDSIDVSDRTGDGIPDVLVG